MSETGQSTASIKRAANEKAWQRSLPLLRAGRSLRRERTGYYYIDGHGGLTAAFVGETERKGVLRRIGADTYGLVEIADA